MAIICAAHDAEADGLMIVAEQTPGKHFQSFSHSGRRLPQLAVGGATGVPYRLILPDRHSGRKVQDGAAVNGVAVASRRSARP